MEPHTELLNVEHFSKQSSVNMQWTHSNSWDGMRLKHTLLWYLMRMRLKLTLIDWTYKHTRISFVAIYMDARSKSPCKGGWKRPKWVTSISTRPWGDFLIYNYIFGPLLMLLWMWRFNYDWASGIYSLEENNIPPLRGICISGKGCITDIKLINIDTLKRFWVYSENK